jgi:hypothetical protein
MKESNNASMPLQVATPLKVSRSSIAHSMTIKSSKIRSDLPCFHRPVRPDSVDSPALAATIRAKAEQVKTVVR